MHMVDIANATYLTYQLERGEEGTLHWQGYLQFKNPVALTAVKRKHPQLQRAHLSQAKGSAQQNIDYCSKEDTRVSLGVTEGDPRGLNKGQRNDLLKAKEAIDAGATMADLFEDHFISTLKYSKGFREYRLMKSAPRSDPMDVRVYWGLTGTGKTRSVYDEFGADNVYSVPCAKGSGTYWDGYDGQETILVDEMYGSRFSWGFLLRLTDRYPMTVPTHGGSVNFASKRIIFTSNSHPGEWYSLPANGWNASNPFKRRCTVIKSFPEGHLWDPSLEAFSRAYPGTHLAGSRAALISTLNEFE